MKFLKQSKFLKKKIFISEKDLAQENSFYKHLHETPKNQNINIYLNKRYFFEKKLFTIFSKNLINYKCARFVSKDPTVNNYFFKTKIINNMLIEGKFLTAVKTYNNTFNLLYSFFENYTEDLNSYDLYETYYEYSIKNKTKFFNPLFLYYNIIPVLQPSFILGFKKFIKKKKKKKPNQLIIKYIQPNRRFFLTLKMIFVYSRSFIFKKKHESYAYGLLNLFLSNKNSLLYKRKILAYEKLIKLTKKK